MAAADRLKYYEYFLDPKNHRPGIPIDAISYHFYANPGDGDQASKPEEWNFCGQADKFLATVRKIEAIRKHLSPGTKTAIDELGVIAPDQSWKNQPLYWNAAGAMYAYLFFGIK